MTMTRARWRFAFLFGLASLFGAGCNLGALPYFLGFGDDNVPPGEMKLAGEDKKKEVKAVILVYSGLESRPEFITVDRELSGLLTRQLQQRCKENKENVTLVSASKVQDFKNNHPDWHSMRMEEIGERFKADYVIYIEVDALSLYEQGSANQLYRGRTELTVKLYNLHQTDQDAIEKHFNCVFPNAKGPVPVDDQNPREFYLGFLGSVAKHLTWYFTPHPFSDEGCE